MFEPLDNPLLIAPLLALLLGMCVGLLCHLPLMVAPAIALALGKGIA